MPLLVLSDANAMTATALQVLSSYQVPEGQ